MVVDKSRRGQESLDYIGTYGWVILTTLVIAAFIYQSGMLSMAASQKSLEGFSSGLKVVDYSIATDPATKSRCTVTLKLLNVEGQRIEIPSGANQGSRYKIGVNEGTGIGGLMEDNVLCRNNNPPCTVENGEMVFLVLFTDPFGAGTGLTCDGDGVTSAELYVKYITANNNLPHMASGTIQMIPEPNPTYVP